MNCPDLTPEDLERLKKIAEDPCPDLTPSPYAEIVVEAFKKENPTFIFAIKEVLRRGGTREDFEARIKRLYGPGWETSVNVAAALLIFDYYENKKK